MINEEIEKFAWAVLERSRTLLKLEIDHSNVSKQIQTLLATATPEQSALLADLLEVARHMDQKRLALLQCPTRPLRPVVRKVH